ncbi:2Fe-2S iron-sulfur cluster binding domain-containing protein [Tsukamurella sputi]|uniref:2Fe-2S iron-sulfur cluster binding domain-containing protein n=1 Tax=Tsukamurella sputi TaxID=2591848 RepID=A0A5C5RUE7_9ACTN|nr:2Fe-2S iron-sulfur cluster binding domain-containing protein [Tsukamurella sputi]TWS26434.1 2Fe-2S iron-sulfur cluster binding domain-containing protein [Tsukamurella sputi]
MESTAAQSQTIRILPEDVTIDHRSGESIVEAIRRNGYRTKYLCRRGGCGQCTAHLVEGTVYYPEAVSDSVLGVDEAGSGACLPCRARPDGAVTVRLAAGDRLRDVLGPLRPTHH